MSLTNIKANNQYRDRDKAFWDPTRHLENILYSQSLSSGGMHDPKPLRLFSEMREKVVTRVIVRKTSK